MVVIELPQSQTALPRNSSKRTNGIDLLIFGDATGDDNFKVSNGGIGTGTVIPSAPGSYNSPVWFNCAACVFGGGYSAASNTIVNDAVSAAEPGTIALVGLGLAAMLTLKRRRKPVDDTVWEALA